MLSRWSLDQLQQRFPDHRIGIPGNLMLTNASNNIDIPDHEFYTARSERPTQKPSIDEQRKNLQRIQDNPRSENNLPDEDLDALPIQWNPKQPIPGTTIEELNHRYSCNAALAGIKKLIPAQYRQKSTELISTMFHAGKTYEITINISESFLDSDHWAMFKYEKLMKRTELRQYLIQKASDKDYNIVKKNESQDQEMEKISGAAKIIYDIILHCKFIPMQYVCILAVLMDRGKHPTFICSSMRMPTGHYIDLFLESGIFTTTKQHIIQEVPTKSNLSCSIEEQFSRIIMEDPTTGTTQNNIPQMSEIQEQITQPISPIINEVEGMNPIYPFDQQEIQLGITLQKSYDSLQESYNSFTNQTIPQQSQLTEDEQAAQIIEDHGFTIQSDSEESIEPPEDTPTTTSPTGRGIFVYGLTEWKINDKLQEAFEGFGPIEKIRRVSQKTAIIRFEHPKHAQQAIAKMNGTVFMKEIISVTKAKPKRRTKKEIRKEAEQYEDQADDNAGTSTSFTIINDDQADNHEGTPTSFTIINNDQSTWEELEQDTKDFDIDIKPFDIEDQINSAIQENAQIHHQPYSWNDSIRQNIKQEIIDEEQEDNEDSSLQTSCSIPSLESKQNTEVNTSPSSERTTSITPYSPIQIQIPPISPTSSTSCHGFESPTSYSPNYSTRKCLDQRLEAYNDHSWDIAVMEHVDIKPNKTAKFLIRVTSEFQPNIRYSLRNQNTFVLTSSLTPYPQINDGIYETQEKFDYVHVRNSGKSNWKLKAGSILMGVKAHTHKYVLQSLQENNTPNDLAKWHYEAKLFAKLNEWNSRFDIINTNQKNVSINPWNIK